MMRARFGRAVTPDELSSLTIWLLKNGPAFKILCCTHIEHVAVSGTNWHAFMLPLDDNLGYRNVASHTNFLNHDMSA